MSQLENDKVQSNEQNAIEQPAQDIELPVLNSEKSEDKPTESGCCGACGG
ncbi:hypothetical protein ACKLNO_08705 [Neisseriaceae bacterium B1]